MKKTIDGEDFVQAFQKIRPENFSLEGLRTLFSYLEEMESDLGEEMELDVIALCCEYSEYDSAEEAANKYGWTPDEGTNEDERDEDALDWLRDRTTVIEVDGGGVITQDF